MQPSCQEGPHPRGLGVLHVGGTGAGSLRDVSCEQSFGPPLLLKINQNHSDLSVQHRAQTTGSALNVIPGKEQIQFDHNLIIRFLALI